MRSLTELSNASSSSSPTLVTYPTQGTSRSSPFPVLCTSCLWIRTRVLANDGGTCASLDSIAMSTLATTRPRNRGQQRLVRSSRLFDLTFTRFSPHSRDCHPARPDNKNTHTATGSPVTISGLYNTIATMLIETSALYTGNSSIVGPFVAGSYTMGISLPTPAEVQVLAPLRLESSDRLPNCAAD